MVLLQYLPSPVLQEFIRVFRVVRFSFNNAKNVPFKPYPPKPEHCLSFYPRDPEIVVYAKSGKRPSNLKAVLFGQQNEVTNRYVGTDFLVFQVVFQPGALYRLTGISSHELTNCYIDAETIFSSQKIKEVNEKLANANSYALMVDIVEGFLQAHINKAKKELHRVDIVSKLILQKTEGIKIEWLAKESCLSLRQYDRKFIERMGVSPKYFVKVVRFENAFRMKNRYPHLDWLTIALQCGYYDYQHLTKDYHELTLQKPTDFHLLDLSSPERKFGEADIY